MNISLLILSLFGLFIISKQDESPKNVLDSSEIIEKDFNREFTKYAQTGVVSEQLNSIYDVLKLPNELRYKEMNDLPEATNVSTYPIKSCYSKPF